MDSECNISSAWVQGMKLPFASLSCSEYQFPHHFFSFFFFIVVQIQFSAFSPHPTPAPQLSPPPSHFYSPTSIIVHVSFIIVPANPSPSSPEILSPLPSVHCQPVLPARNVYTPRLKVAGSFILENMFMGLFNESSVLTLAHLSMSNRMGMCSTHFQTVLLK